MLTLASEAKALFAAGVPARWDHESVFQDLMMIADGDRTMFDGVYQVPPGHYLLATRQRTQIVPYWDLQYPTAERPAPQRSVAEHVERLRDALLESIRLRLRADVTVGVYLSGGLDSCSVLLKGRMRELALDTLRPERIAALPFFEPQAVARFLANPPPPHNSTARSGYFGMMITMASLCVLQEAYRL